MKKEILTHLLTFIVLFALISLIRGWWSLDVKVMLGYFPFWLGGILGTILPDIDHLIYIFFLKPQELTSQRVNYLTKNGDVRGAASLLAATRSERTHLVFHTVLFQIIFFILTFLVVTSSGGLLGRGLVLSFSLHLLVDQLVDLRITGNLTNWFLNFPIVLDLNQQRWYLGIIGLSLLVFAFLF